MSLIKDQLKKLDATKLLVFAYLTCERLYPNYVYFSKVTNSGDPSELRSAIDFIEENIFITNVDKTRSDSLINEIDRITPMPEHYETILASSALDACGVVYETLNFMHDRQIERIYTISTFATDSVDMYIQDSDQLDFNTDPSFQQKIDNHPLMKKETSIQLGIISFLSKIQSITSEDIATLLKLQDNNKGNLNL